MSSHSPSLEIDTLYADKMESCLGYTGSEWTAAEADFSRRYPDYARTRHLDALRAAQYQRLDALKHVYLDYTGGGLYASSQVEQHHRLLEADVYGNPHSFNPTSLAATHLVEQTRETIHEYFHADPDEYRIIFTSNASGALKLVGESYPFEDHGQYLLTFDNHNSVNGIREFARLHGAPVTYVPITLPDLRMDATALRDLLGQATPRGNNLFAYPAQSNFSGVQHDLEWVAEAKGCGWDVLLDCAAYLPTNRFDLRECKPDFVTLSFYKMFGYPTGIGALIVRRDKLSKLRRPWFAGGTVEIVSTLAPVFFRAEDEAAFEDGTVNYLSIPAVEIGLRHLEESGMDAIHTRVVALTGYLLDSMTALRHANGTPLVQIYGPTTTEGRGGTIAFNLLDAKGEMFDVRLVEAMSNQARISLRTGCFCNPGAGENAFHLTRQNVEECSVAAFPVTYERYVAALSATTGHTVTGAIRVSVGIVSNFADVFYFIRFLHSFLDLESPGLLD